MVYEKFPDPFLRESGSHFLPVVVVKDGGAVPGVLVGELAFPGRWGIYFGHMAAGTDAVRSLVRLITPGSR